MKKHRHISKDNKSQYKYVTEQLINGNKYWYIRVPNHTKKRYKTEAEAARAVDIILIKMGKSPVNILKKRT